MHLILSFSPQDATAVVTTTTTTIGLIVVSAHLSRTTAAAAAAATIGGSCRQLPFERRRRGTECPRVVRCTYVHIVHKQKRCNVNGKTAVFFFSEAENSRLGEKVVVLFAL